MAKRLVFVFLALSLTLGLLVACADTKQDSIHAIRYSIPNEWEKTIENGDGNYYTVNENEQAFFGVDFSADVIESKYDEDAKKDHFDEVKNSLINEEKEDAISNLQTETIEGELPYYLIQYEYINSKKEGTIYVWIASMFVEEDLYDFFYSSKDVKDRTRFLKIIDSVEMQK